MNRVARGKGYLGLVLALGSGLVACGALEGLGSPPDIAEPDASAAPSDAEPTAAEASSDAGVPDTSEPVIEAAAPEAASASFALTLPPGPVTVVRGGSTVVTVTIAPSPGFTGDVTVTASGFPNGTTAASLHIPSGETTGQLTLNAAASATESVTALLSVQGSSGSDHAAPATAPLIVRGLPGTLDLTFGTNGTLVLPIYESGATGPGWAWPAPPLAGLAIQPDGKIVYAGHGYLYSPTIADSWPIILGRLNADGTPDTTFNSTGQLPGTIVEVPTGDSNFVPSGQGAVSVLPSGDIAVGGYISVPGAPQMMFVAEFTAAGTHETGFAGNGIVPLWGNYPDHFPGGFLVQPDGKLVLGASYGSSGPALVRLLADGGADTTFDSLPADGGIGFATYSAYPQAYFGPMVLLGNGDILAGIGIDSAASPPPLAVAISSTTATLDEPFGTRGTVVLPAFSGPVQGIALESDGSAVFVGSTATSIELAHVVQGNGDGSFGDAGVASP
ncbi:MAG TPA: hypothetical protein VGI39_46470, partial [Polyangiaceae bacterium]